jgi:tetratricopeptide (TPR) repeat protein
MPDGTFVGTLPFNQADAVEVPNMLTVMAHLHTKPNPAEVASGLEATEMALEVASRHPDHDSPSHFFFEPSALPRTKNSKFADEEESTRKLQSQYVKSQIWATRALLLAHANRLSDALSAVEHAVHEAPECPSLALVAKGDILTMSKSPAEEIFPVYLKAIEHDPNSEFAHLAIIHLLLSNGEGREALKFSTKLLQLADDGYLLNPRLAIEVHASILFHLCNYDAAVKICIAHLPPQGNDDERTSEDSEEDPYHIRLLNIVAQSLHQQGKCEEAQSYFDRALRPDPMNVYTWNEKGRCLMQAKRFDDALNYFDRALVLNPDDIRSICNRALCLCLLGNVSQGSEILIEYEKGGNHSAAAEWLQSLSPTERAFHFDSMTAARELKKRRDREAVTRRDEQASDPI